jgi:hypothetical protein
MSLTVEHWSCLRFLLDAPSGPIAACRRLTASDGIGGSWIFPKDPDFAEKAGRLLDLYSRQWEDKPLKTDEFVISADEKTSIQAGRRLHLTEPCKPGRAARVENRYKRGGAWVYLSALDVHHTRVFGRCEAENGIAPFGRLVEQVMTGHPITMPVVSFGLSITVPFVADKGQWSACASNILGTRRYASDARRPGRLQEAAWPQRYSPDMPKKVIPIPEPDDSDKGPAMAERHTRVICNIGGQRYALDFWSRASEISPVDAAVLPFPPRPPHTSKKVRQPRPGGNSRR